MPRISAVNPVRRRLFFEDHSSQIATNDNLSNILQKNLVRERFEKQLKWNFDFDKEMPLPGKYKWYKTNGKYDFIGMEDEDTEEIEKVETAETNAVSQLMDEVKAVLHDDCEDILLENKKVVLHTKVFNETTPSNKSNDDVVPVLRKRKNDLDSFVNEKEAKRKLSFD